MTFYAYIRMPGLSKELPRNENGTWPKGSVYGSKVRYYPAKKSLQFVIDDFKASDFQKNNETIRYIFEFLKDLIWKNKRSGNEYLLMSWITEWYAEYYANIRRRNCIPANLYRGNLQDIHETFAFYRTNESGTCVFETGVTF